jgi:hypothetical protein
MLTTSTSTRDPDVAFLRVVAIVIGLIPVLIAIAHHAPFGAEPTVGILMILAGLFAR